jgi:hypothetical protein
LFFTVGQLPDPWRGGVGAAMAGGNTRLDWLAGCERWLGRTWMKHINPLGAQATLMPTSKMSPKRQLDAYCPTARCSNAYRLERMRWWYRLCCLLGCLSFLSLSISLCPCCTGVVAFLPGETGASSTLRSPDTTCFQAAGCADGRRASSTGGRSSHLSACLPLLRLCSVMT